MKYLIINYDKTSSRHFHITDIFDELVEKFNNEYLFTSLEELKKFSNDLELKNYFLSTYNSIPKYIISFSGVGSFNDIYQVLTKVTNLVFILDDIHHGGLIKKERIPVLKSSKIIFCTYSYLYEQYKLPKPNKLYFLPHSARWICDFNSNPINKILISGRISDIYKDRVFAHNYGLKNPDKIDILKCNVSYRNIDLTNQNIIYGKKFYDSLNKYLCCFVDTTRNYILAKTFEICASGSLLFCMDTEVKIIMKELGFIDGINYISCNRENFEEKVNWILDVNNINKINEIRFNGYELIKNRHLWTHRMEFLKNILENE